MKTSKLLVALAAVAFAGVAAADTSPLAVTAKIKGICKITGTTDVAFGTIDPSSGSNATGTGKVSFWCTKGTSYTLSTNDGTNPSGTQKRMKGGSGSDYLPYTLALASTTGTGAGKTTTIDIDANGTVAVADFADATAGDYADSVTVTVTP